MSSWLQRHAGSQQTQLAATAVLSGAAVAGAILGYQALKRKEAVKELKASIPSIDEKHIAGKLTKFGGADPVQQLSKEDERSAALARRAQMGDYDDELILEQLARNRVFLTDEGLEKLRSSFIIVVGCGGVGSHAAASLSRSGVSKIRLIDFDQVTLSSLNRHALATLADVGTPKVHCIRKRLEQITPWTKFDCRNELFSGSVADDLLAPWLMDDSDKGRKPDYVLDCIDNITSKVELLHYCHSNSIPVISSMGAGCKSDPTCVTVGDISTSTDDPLSRSTRRRLKILGVSTGIPVVFSTEKPGPGKASLLPLAEEEFNKGQVGELSVLPDFRARILPVLGTMPAVFGYTVANHVICDIAGYPRDYSIARKGKDKIYDSVQTATQGFMERLARVEVGQHVIGLRLPITKDDVVFLVDEIWRGKSAITGLPGRLILVPWERPARGFVPDPEWEKEGQKFLPFELKDLVCMTKEESAKHEKEVLLGDKKPEELYDEKTIQRVKERMEEAGFYEKYR
ncbi:ThiF domain protein [Aspergillus nomiae NRRL 13137]|uniref:ThiF domain protein n=1 Tax=Aspergillus nomiae NRRL (strain ATCC 15546 / NRRL 13137 / CBS 260.88 / M93) TaxID=1509407 RepID=A0A0L1J1D3_ASPN3|nr:ThiF domain protein [Aspergillus nomiae NRRL 13137]KNG85455.1 ThiF domain protein [Aspergillus nomiae NRRL 13137]